MSKEHWSGKFGELPNNNIEWDDTFEEIYKRLDLNKIKLRNKKNKKYSYRKTKIYLFLGP